ncbi:hypothetical protein PPERSA_05753 [Pseudocohnilembus persalinus]|uniref:tRNA (guanine(26)-N(2))-dimethyltransferase n=1 Tax=Pseudocohnilembus persalinus TaxID=266149 RepID=A0A0V0QIJ6_PSEPJ|nr:hypothetical protein PPERSA_05753 [Pseudocohnilembus persalinus]|eukprot:KRX01914.1 hypothetical protein PPERSA_05753 [Pseudocohnilembus persalinus]
MYKIFFQGKEYFQGVTILDALSASGLRTIRFLKELKDVKKVYANDLSEASHKLMMDNFKLNELDLNKIQMTNKDANELMYMLKFQPQKEGDREEVIDVIDLDPYGSSVPFLDAAIQCAKTDSLLCITCTDSKVLCGPDQQKCFYQYGTSRAKVPAFQENALRIVLYTVQNIASKYGKSIVPLFSYMQKEFYCRLFIQIKNSRSEAAKTYAQVGNVYYCEQCYNYHTHTYGKEKNFKQDQQEQQQVQNNKKKDDDKEEVKEKKQDAKQENKQYLKYNANYLKLPSNVCEMCGSYYHINGPLWLGELHNKEFINKLLHSLESEEMELQSSKKITGLLKSVLNEFETFHDQVPPLGISPQRVLKLMRTQQPSKKELESAFKSLGYQFCPTFTNPDIYKTDAPNNIIYDIVKKYKIKLVGEENLFNKIEQDKLPVPYKLLSREVEIDPKFDLQIAKQSHYAVFLPNPKNFGPLSRATVQNQNSLFFKLKKNNYEKYLIRQVIDEEKQSNVQVITKNEIGQQQEEQQIDEKNISQDNEENGEKVTKKVKL